MLLGKVLYQISGMLEFFCILLAIIFIGYKKAQLKGSTVLFLTIILIQIIPYQKLLIYPISFSPSISLIQQFFGFLSSWYHSGE